MIKARSCVAMLGILMLFTCMGACAEEETTPSNEPLQEEDMEPQEEQCSLDVYRDPPTYFRQCGEGMPACPCDFGCFYGYCTIRCESGSGCEGENDCTDPRPRNSTLPAQGKVCWPYEE